MPAPTKHHLLIGDCTKAESILDLPAIDLLVTSPPYFNAPFDYDELFPNYASFLEMISNFAELYFRTLKPGGIAAINIDDMLIAGIKYPIISDTIKIFSSIGYQLKGKIIWKKPEGYIRISRRSGVLLQNPYPMYYYPDNLLEVILLFQKPSENRIEGNKKLFFEDIWEITNVLPLKGRLETNIAAFPDDLPLKLIKAFSEKETWICDPFLGSGTTMKVAREHGRHSIGVEILEELVPVIRKKSGFTPENLKNYFDSDQLIIQDLQTDETKDKKDKNYQSKSRTFLSQALNIEHLTKTNYRYQLLLMDCRNILKIVFKTEFSKLLNELYPGRILVVLFDSLDDSKNNVSLNQLADYIMQHGLRFRDKITVQYQPEGQWEVITNFKSKVIFHHCYYEVLLFQKGKFEYKTKSKQEKQACLIDKDQFQKEKWYLSLWDFRNHPKNHCDSIVVTRLLELFLYNDEVIGSNIRNILCPKRRFTSKYFSLI